MNVSWSPQALTRINEIAAYIAQNNASAAEKWVNAVFNRVHLLRDFPHSGRIVPEMNHPSVREVFVKKYRIVYRVERKLIKVMTVRHGMQILPLDEIEE